MTNTTPEAARPRVRFGAIVWGLLLGAGAVAVLLTVVLPGGRENFVRWISTVTPADLVLIVVIALGVVLLLSGLVAIVKRAQRHPPIG